MDKVYTYILYDRVRDIYKIGQSINPKSRVRQLSVPGEIAPITVINENIEKMLHTKFADYRMVHPVYIDGKTEWFSYGGKFKEYVDNVPREEFHFYTPHSIYKTLEEQGQLRVDTPQTIHKLREQEYYKYIIGRKLLLLLGYLFYSTTGYDSIHSGVEIQGSKTFITAEILEDILERYEVAIVSTHYDSTVSKFKRRNKGKLFSRKIGTLDTGAGIYLLVSELKIT